MSQEEYVDVGVRNVQTPRDQGQSNVPAQVTSGAIRVWASLLQVSTGLFPHQSRQHLRNAVRELERAADGLAGRPDNATGTTAAYGAPQAAPEPQTAREPQPQTTPQPQTAREPHVVPEAQAAPQPRAEPEVQTTPEPQVVPEPQAGPEVQTAPEPQAGPESQAVPEPRAEPEAQAGPEVQTAPEPRTVPGRQSRPQPQTTLQPQTAREPQATQTAQAEPEARKKSETRVSKYPVEIIHIEYDPPSHMVEGEFVRLRNTTDNDIELTGWTLSDQAGTTYTFPEYTLAARAEMQVWSGTGMDMTGNLFWGRKRAVWNNTGDTAILRDADGKEVCRFSYTRG